MKEKADWHEWSVRCGVTALVSASGIALTHLDIACLYLIVHMLLSWRMGPSQLYVGSFAPVQAAAALHLHVLRKCLLHCI